MSEGTGMDSEADFAEFFAFVKEFITESDRAAVILGAAKIDTQLYQVLQKVLVPCASGSDALLDVDKPLSSFSSRINIIYRLGLIDAQLAWALHLIRKIRNAFAHELSGVNLVTGPQRNRIRELVAALRPDDHWETFTAAIQKMGNHEKASAEFRAVVAQVSVRLQVLFRTCKTMTSEKAVTLIPPERTNSGEETLLHEQAPE